MRNTGQCVEIAGRLYALCEHGGQIYIYDPQHDIDAPNRGAGLEGLGVTGGENTAWTTANVALNFIPGVGNILSAISSLAQGIFGGGDPRDIADVWEGVITLREKLAQARNLVAGRVVDPFTVDPALDRRGDGDSAGGALAAAITAEVMSLPSSDRHKVKRESEYAAIQAMQQEMAQLTEALKQRGLVQQITAQLTAPAPPAGVTPPLSQAIAPGYPAPAAGVTPSLQSPYYAPAASVGNLQLSSYLPWLLPIGALLIYSRTKQ